MGGNVHQLKENPLKVFAVRGPLTRNFLLSKGILCPEVYGDPALLLPLHYKPKVVKKYKLGIIPHYVDAENKYIQDILESNPNDVLIISMSKYKKWYEIIDNICMCECVVSSSLHGLIVSDAYCIPNNWVSFSNNVAGGAFKYQDYFMSVGRSIDKPLLIDHPMSIDVIINSCKSWHPIHFDLKPLLNSCPFKLKL